MPPVPLLVTMPMATTKQVLDLNKSSLLEAHKGKDEDFQAVESFSTSEFHSTKRN